MIRKTCNSPAGYIMLPLVNPYLLCYRHYLSARFVREATPLTDRAIYNVTSPSPVNLRGRMPTAADINRLREYEKLLRYQQSLAASQQRPFFSPPSLQVLCLVPECISRVISSLNSSLFHISHHS
eukprot:sb/3475624/